MYHIELREFPRNMNRFNLSGTQIGAILVPWAQREPVDVNGESWDPKQATIIVIEGPEIPIHRLSMGRGWPLAQRQGEEVTARVLEEARRAVADGSAYRQQGGAAGDPAPAVPPSGRSSAPGAHPQGSDEPAGDYPSAPRGADGGASDSGDSLAAGVELAGLLGADAAGLLTAWRAVAERTSGLSPSESLALAERELAGKRGR